MNKLDLEKQFFYKNGELYYIKNSKLAGNVSPKGYKRVFFNGKYLAIHRVIYLLNYGYLPKFIDHIDGNPLNNNINNLRPATISTNGMNRKIGKNNKTGAKNVIWDTTTQKWRVQIYYNKKVFRKYFKDFELAELVAIEAKHKFHKDFARIA